MDLELKVVHLGKEQRISLDQPHIKIGSLMSNQVVIAGAGIDGIHALLEKNELGEWLLTDLGSDLGIQINGKKIEIESEIKLGDIIKIGSAQLSFVTAENVSEITGMRLPTAALSSSYDESIKAGLSQASQASLKSSLDVSFSKNEKTSTISDFQTVPMPTVSNLDPKIFERRISKYMLFSPRTAKPTGDVLEVVAYWEDRILDVEHFHPALPGFEKVTVGNPVISHFLAAGVENLGRYTLADVHEDGYTLNLFPGMTARLRRNGRVDQVKDGKFNLSAKDISHVRYGPIRYFFLFTRPPVLNLPPAKRNDPFFFKLINFAMIFYVVLCFSLLISDPPPKELEDDVWSTVSTVEKVHVKEKKPNDVVEVKKEPIPPEVPPTPKPKPVEPAPAVEAEKPRPPTQLEKEDKPKPVERLTKAVTQKPKEITPAPPKAETSKPAAPRSGNNKPGGMIKGNTSVSLKGSEGKSNKPAGVNLSKLGLGVGRIASQKGPGAINTKFSNSAGGGGAGSGSGSQTFGLGGLEASRSMGIAGSASAANQFGGGGGLIEKGKMGSSFGSARQGANVDIGAGDPMVSGGLSQDEILGVIRVHLNDIRHCYEKLLQKAPEASGKIKMNFIINQSGRVSSTKVESSTIDDYAMKGCLSDAIKRWQFPKPRGANSVTVNYPFTFNPL